MGHTAVLVLCIAININLGICEEPKRKLPQFGRPMREEFYFDPNFVQLNHGACGTHPKAVGQALQKFQLRTERNIDLWIRRDVKIELVKVRQMLAKIVNADSEDVVMIPGTTSGMNAVFRSMVFAPGERILHLSSIFNSVGSVIQYIIDISNGAVSKLVFNVNYPMTNEDFLEKLEKFLKETEDPKHPIRIAVVDHITSKPGVVIPLDKVIPMLKRRNITVLIDGAHAIGQIPINITALDPDYYLTDCHKWLYAARGCALLYVKKEHQKSIHPANIHSNYRQPTDFHMEFYWTGTMEYSAYMTVPTALQFRRDAGGEDAIMQYTHNLAWNGGKHMATRFGTRVMQTKDQMASMVDVQLPLDNPQDPRLTTEWWIDEQLVKHPNTYSTVYFHNGHWWARISAQIYNDMSDFETSAQHFLKICNELNASQNKTSRMRYAYFRLS